MHVEGTPYCAGTWNQILCYCHCLVLAFRNSSQGDRTTIFKGTLVPSSSPLCVSLSGFTTCLIAPCSPALPHCFLFLIQGCMMLFLSQRIIHFLAGSTVLIRINIWVLFTGLQSARIAWGIQFHKLFLMGNQWQIEKKGSWGSNSKPFPILVWKLGPGWFIAFPKVVRGRDKVSLRSPLADHQIEQLAPFPVLHEISHRIFHFKSNGMFSEIRRDSSNVYGCFAGILFGSGRDLKIKYISFWWPGARAGGRWGPRLGPAVTCQACSKKSLPLACLAKHLQPTPRPSQIPLPSSSLPVSHWRHTQMLCKIKKGGASPSHLAEEWKDHMGLPFHIRTFFFFFFFFCLCGG